jgi:hypothetical protein
MKLAEMQALKAGETVSYVEPAWELGAQESPPLIKQGQVRYNDPQTRIRFIDLEDKSGIQFHLDHLPTDGVEGLSRD